MGIDTARIEEAFQKADTAFWAAVAKAFPEITTGDFAPDATFEIERAMRLAINRWVESNTPEVEA